MNVLDLFSGIGGFSLGLERAGMRTVAFCEIDPFCRRVLKKHWPHVPCYEDVRTLTADRLRADGIAPDVICGGFPCQDITTAGRQAGIEAARSGLWSDLCRIIGEVGPRYAVVENVSNLLAGPGEQPGAWFGAVLRDLATVGYDAEWHSIRAADVGAPHLRDRIWIIAEPQHPYTDFAGSHRTALHEHGSHEFQNEQICLAGPICEDVADATGERRREAREDSERRSKRTASRSEILGYPGEARRSNLQGNTASTERSRFGAAIRAGFASRGGDCWSIEPDVGRVADGVPARVDRLRSLGNAVVPQIPEIIGRAIMNAARQS